MARFFFDFHDDKPLSADLEGLDLDDAQAARREAIQALVQAIAFEAGDHDDRAIACHVRDESGRVIYCAGINVRGGWVPEDAAEAG